MIWPFALVAEGFRVATLHAELTRKGPGLLLRDIERGEDDQIKALKQISGAVLPDILFLTKVDFDQEQQTARALQSTLGYEYAFALPPNTMVPTALDLNGDGRPRDRQAWARYAGEGAMLLLSRYPVKLRFHLNDVLWRDVDGAQLPKHANGAAFPSIAAQGVQKLVGQGMWVVEIAVRGSTVVLVLFQNQTPVFDGAEDMNGLRNRDQLKLLDAIMSGRHGPFPSEQFILIGNANLDPERGQGDRAAINALLKDARLQDPQPRSSLGGNATAIWEKPGPMRVSYILPSRDWIIEQAEVAWPNDGPLREAAEQASRHRMIWMDIKPPQ